VPEVENRLARSAFALAVLCALAACAETAPKSEAQRQSDRETAQRVQAALDSDKRIYARHVVVRADNGVVRLTGFVWDPPDLAEAAKVAGLVPGVTRVVNDLELERNGAENTGVTR
jgi:osmotically-inducible protein OsmY